MFLRKLFHKNEINPYTVSDKAVFVNVDKRLVLYVRSDAAPLMVNLRKAQDKLSSVKPGSTDEERVEAARFFAEAIFGKDQAEKLMQFYEGEPVAVISACGQYFSRQLGKKITEAQKK